MATVNGFMENFTLVAIPYKNSLLSARVALSAAATSEWMFFLNGAGVGITKDRFLNFHQVFANAGINSLSFDYLGTGSTGGSLAESSLADRLQQCVSVLQWVEMQYGTVGKLGVYGVSMGCYVALALDDCLRREQGRSIVRKLVLAAGAAYAAAAHAVHFGPDFTAILKSEADGKPSWANSPSFEWLSSSTADIFLIVSENDEVVPRAISDTYKTIAENRSVGSLQYMLLPGETHYIGRNGVEAGLASAVCEFYKI